MEYFNRDLLRFPRGLLPQNPIGDINGPAPGETLTSLAEKTVEVIANGPVLTQHAVTAFKVLKVAFFVLVVSAVAYKAVSLLRKAYAASALDPSKPVIPSGVDTERGFSRILEIESGASTGAPSSREGGEDISPRPLVPQNGSNNSSRSPSPSNLVEEHGSEERPFGPEPGGGTLVGSPQSAALTPSRAPSPSSQSNRVGQHGSEEQRPGRPEASRGTLVGSPQSAALTPSRARSPSSPSNLVEEHGSGEQRPGGPEASRGTPISFPQSAALTPPRARSPSSPSNLVEEHGSEEQRPGGPEAGGGTPISFPQSAALTPPRARSPSSPSNLVEEHGSEEQRPGGPEAGGGTPISFPQSAALTPPRARSPSSPSNLTGQHGSEEHPGGPEASRGTLVGSPQRVALTPSRARSPSSPSNLVEEHGSEEQRPGGPEASRGTPVSFPQRVAVTPSQARSLSSPSNLFEEHGSEEQRPGGPEASRGIHVSFPQSAALTPSRAPSPSSPSNLVEQDEGKEHPFGPEAGGGTPISFPQSAALTPSRARSPSSPSNLVEEHGSEEQRRGGPEASRGTLVGSPQRVAVTPPRVPSSVLQNNSMGKNDGEEPLVVSPSNREASPPVVSVDSHRPAFTSEISSSSQEATGEVVPHIASGVGGNEETLSDPTERAAPSLPSSPAPSSQGNRLEQHGSEESSAPSGDESTPRGSPQSAVPPSPIQDDVIWIAPRLSREGSSLIDSPHSDSSVRRALPGATLREGGVSEDVEGVCYKSVGRQRTSAEDSPPRTPFVGAERSAAEQVRSEFPLESDTEQESVAAPSNGVAKKGVRGDRTDSPQRGELRIENAHSDPLGGPESALQARRLRVVIPKVVVPVLRWSEDAGHSLSAGGLRSARLLPCSLRGISVVQERGRSVERSGRLTERAKGPREPHSPLSEKEVRIIGGWSELSKSSSREWSQEQGSGSRVERSRDRTSVSSGSQGERLLGCLGGVPSLQQSELEARSGFLMSARSTEDTEGSSPIDSSNPHESSPNTSRFPVASSRSPEAAGIDLSKMGPGLPDSRGSSSRLSSSSMSNAPLTSRPSDGRRVLSRRELLDSLRVRDSSDDEREPSPKPTPPVDQRAAVACQPPGDSLSMELKERPPRAPSFQPNIPPSSLFPAAEEPVKRTLVLPTHRPNYPNTVKVPVKEPLGVPKSPPSALLRGDSPAPQGVTSRLFERTLPPQGESSPSKGRFGRRESHGRSVTPPFVVSYSVERTEPSVTPSRSQYSRVDSRYSETVDPVTTGYRVNITRNEFHIYGARYRLISPIPHQVVILYCSEGRLVGVTDLQEKPVAYEEMHLPALHF